MPTKLTLTKLAQASGGLLQNDSHKLLETFEFEVPESNIVMVTGGAIVKEKRPNQYWYTLIRDANNQESIVFASQGNVKNPWSEQNLIVQIVGEIKAPDGTIEPISEWNYNEWRITNEVVYNDYCVKKVVIFALQKLETNRYLVLAEITIQDKNNVIFGDDYIDSRSGYILLNAGLTRDGPQEIDLVAGNEIQDCAVIVEKIDVIQE